MRKYFYIAFLFTVCSCESLEVDNNNQPDRSRVFSNPSDLAKLAKSAYQSFWQNTHSANLYLTSLIAADQFTSSWYNFAGGYVAKEPRISWNNTVSADNDQVSENFYYGMYSVLSQSVNPVIDQIVNKKIKLGTDGKDNNAILALCYYLQGVIFGQLGLCFDRAIIVKENTNIDTSKLPGYSNYPEVMNAAIESLEKAISICDTADFTFGNSEVVNGVVLTSEKLRRISHSYIARFLALTPRTEKENLYVDWNKVLEHAQQGITEDFGPVGDALPSGGGNWFDINFYYLTNPNILFAFVDCRLIHLMDPDYPSRYWPDGVSRQVHSGSSNGEAKSKDSRLKEDFKYYPSCGFKVERGYYYFSHYCYKRYSYIYTTGSGQLYDFRKYENDLYMAEAYVRLKQINKALEILNDNNNPRLNRGNLDVIPISAGENTVLDAIFYEREIELLGQGFMVGFCDMRRRNMLQKGTYLHYPIPGKELETLQKPYYTFGGINHAGEDGTANGIPVDVCSRLGWCELTK